MSEIDDGFIPDNNVDEDGFIADKPSSASPENIGRLESVNVGVQQGATLGTSDEMKGVVAGLSDDAMRIANLLGLSKTKSPSQVNEDLTNQGFQVPGANKTPYEDARDEERQRISNVANAHQMGIPFTDTTFNPYYFGGNLAGSMLTIPFTPAKVLAPMGEVGTLAPLLSKEFGKQAIKTSVNSVPLSVATGIGMSEANTAEGVLLDGGVAGVAGMVLSPALNKGMQVGEDLLAKTGQKLGQAANMFPGEPWNKMKLGARGVLGISEETGKRIRGILNAQVNKFVGKVDEADIMRVTGQNAKLRNIENNIADNDAKIQQLIGEFNDLSTEQSIYKYDAIKGKTEAITETTEKAKAALKTKIDELEKAKEKLLFDYERETRNAIQDYEIELKAQKAAEAKLKDEATQLKDLKPKEIADKTQRAFEADKAQIKQNYNVLDAELAEKDIKFNVDSDLNKFQKALVEFAGDDEDLLKANEAIVKALSKYKKGGELDRKELIELLNGYENRYGNQVPSGLRLAMKKVPQMYQREYDSFFKGLEGDLRTTQDAQLRNWGHEDLANQYAQNNKAYRAVKLLEDNYNNEKYNASLVSQIQDLGKFGINEATKGNKGIVKDIHEHGKNLPTVDRILPEEIGPYVKRTTETLPSEMQQVASQIANYENLIKKLQSVRSKPDPLNIVKTSDVGVLDQLGTLDHQIASVKKDLQSGSFDEDSMNLLKSLGVELDNLRKGTDDGLFKYEVKKTQNQLDRQDLVKQNKELQKNKSRVLESKPNETELDKVLSIAPADRAAYVRKLVEKYDIERNIGGRGSDIERLENLARELNVESPATSPELEELQSLLSAYKDNISFAINKAGGVATGGETIGTVANALGYLYGGPKKKFQDSIMTPIKKGAVDPALNYVDDKLNYIGKKNLVPTRNGLKSIDEVLSKITNKPLSEITNMDDTGKAALKNTLLQMSPEYRTHMSNEEDGE